jgi:hypothetical protein
MDANLETPATTIPNQDQEKDESSADEDQVLDWSKVEYVCLQNETQVTRTDTHGWTIAERRKDA